MSLKSNIISPFGKQLRKLHLALKLTTLHVLNDPLEL